MKNFYFEGNQFFKEISTKEDFELLKSIYPNFKEARQLMDQENNIEKPSFGFYNEFRGKQTLEEWLQKDKY